ncbi:MAG: Flp family type IVb pilin [Acidimicrobiales bacterium]
MRPSCPSRWRGSSSPDDPDHPRSHERGTTLIEYGLILALALASVFATVDSLQAGAGEFLAADADTIGQPRSLTVPTTAALASTIPTTTSTTEGGETTVGPYTTDDFLAPATTTTTGECRSNAGSANANAGANANANSQAAACATSTASTAPTPSVPVPAVTNGNSGKGNSGKGNSGKGKGKAG